MLGSVYGRREYWGGKPVHHKMVMIKAKTLRTDPKPSEFAVTWNSISPVRGCNGGSMHTLGQTFCQ